MVINLKPRDACTTLRVYKINVINISESIHKKVPVASKFC
jgi:hypothetical protein